MSIEKFPKTYEENFRNSPRINLQWNIKQIFESKTCLFMNRVSAFLKPK